MKLKSFTAAAAAALGVGAVVPAWGVSVTVDSVGVLNPNPSNLTISEATGNTLTLEAARTLVSGAFAAGTGGVIDFQQQFQGGTWPNAGSSTNGVDVAGGNGGAGTVTERASVTAGPLSNPVIFQFYRSDGFGFIDSNTNQGGNIISGGYKSRDPIAAGHPVTGPVDFTTTPGSPTPDAPVPPDGAATPGVGGGYMGITNTGSPVTLTFVNDLSFFGITALPRGATRPTEIIFTLSDETTRTIAPFVVAGQPVFFNHQLSEAELAAGLGIRSATFVHANGVNRYDDLAFVVAPIPEPASLGLLGGAGALGLLARRRRRN